MKTFFANALRDMAHQLFNLAERITPTDIGMTAKEMVETGDGLELCPFCKGTKINPEYLLETLP